MNNENNNLKNAIAHNVKFAIKPGNKWVLPKTFEKLLAEKARQILGDQWWDDPLVRERFDAAFEESYGAREQLKPISYEGFATEAFAFGDMLLGFNKVSQILSRICSSVTFPDNLRVLDVGCGTGILSLFWTKLGAEVIAIDINPLCVKVTKHNLNLNGLSAEVIEGDIKKLLPIKVDLVLANLYKGLLEDLFNLPSFWESKFYLVSGFMNIMEKELLNALKNTNTEIIWKREKDDWIIWLLKNKKKRS